MTDETTADPTAADRSPADVEPARADAPAPRSNVRVVVVSVIVLLVLLAAVAVAAVALRGGRSGGENAPVLPDVGEAPSGAPTGYVNLEGGAAPASTGNFPDNAGDGGPLFRDSATVFLGTTPGRPEPAGDRTDDGLLIAWGTPVENPPGVVNGLAPCAKNRALVVIDTTAVTEKLSGSNTYVNVFADWNRDGRWSGSDGCGDEWPVRNQQVALSSVAGRSGVAVPLTIDAGRQTLDFWYRVTVSVDSKLDGPAPDTTIRYGEAEDGRFVDPALRRAADPRGAEPNDLCTTDPPTVLPARSRSLMRLAGGQPGTRPPVEFASIAPAGREGSGARAGDIRSTLGVAPARSSAWLEVLLPDQPGARKAAVSFDLANQRRTCTAWQLGPDATAEGPIGPLSEPRTPTGSKPAPPGAEPPPTTSSTPTASPPVGITCPYRELNGGEWTSIYLQDLSGGGYSYSTSVGSQPSDATATAGSPRLFVEGSSPPRAGLSTWTVNVLGTPGAQPRQVLCSTTVNGKLPPRSQPLSDEQPQNGGTPRESPGPSITFGSYKIRFSKKSDSCGRFAFREDDTIQVRPAPKGQIEISRPATGNKSLGNLTGNDNSFLATGSGQRKDGSAYVEQYQGRFNGPNVSGNYELQQGECRATFSFDGAKS